MLILTKQMFGTFVRIGGINMNRTHRINISSIIKLSIIMLFILASFHIIRNVKEATAANTENNLICTSVKIDANDTLWSIAEEYYTGDYKDMNAYIKEIKKANNLKSDIIHSGSYLIIPHYTR